MLDVSYPVRDYHSLVMLSLYARCIVSSTRLVNIGSQVLPPCHRLFHYREFVFRSKAYVCVVCRCIVTSCVSRC